MSSPSVLLLCIPGSLGGDAAQRAAALEGWLGQIAPRLKIRVEVAGTYADMRQGLLGGRWRLAWAPPLVATRIIQAGGRPLVRMIRDGQGTFRSALVQRKDRPVDLTRPGVARAVWVDPESLSGYLLAREWIRSQGANPERLWAAESFAHSFPRALEELLSGNADLTAIHAPADPTRSDPLLLVSSESRHKLEVLAFTAESPTDAIVATADIVDADFQYLRRRLLASVDEPEGAEILRAVFDAESFEPVAADAYTQLEALLSKPDEDASPRCASCGARGGPGTRFCGSCGRALRRGEPVAPPPEVERTWSEERKLATVLFADIAGFTTLSGGLEPEAVRELVNECFAPLTGEIERQGGTVIKYIGDCVMAAFGVPLSSEDDAERGVRAALEMNLRLEEKMGMLRARFGAPVRVRIGLEAGVVMVGSVGAGPSSRHDIMGGTVNLTSRIQGASRPGEVLIGPTLQRLVSSAFELEALGPASLKGIDEPVPLFRVRRELPRALPGTGLDAAALDLRSAELERLLASYVGMLASGGPRIASLSADPGLGRSRLLRNFEEQVGTHPSRPVFLRASGQPSPVAATFALAMFGRMLRDHLNVTANQPLEEARARVMQGVRAAWESPENPEAQDAAAALADVCGLRFGPTPDEWSGGRTDAEGRALMALSSWLRQLGRTRPVVLVLHELQWVEDATLSFIERLVPALGGTRTFIATSAPPEFFARRPQRPWTGAEIEEIPLLPVPPDRMRTFIDSMLQGADEHLAATRELLLERAEGNPGYARELVRLLIDRGVLRSAEDVVRPEEAVQGLDLPESIQGVLQARLDRLPPMHKELLKRAAVVGRVFWSGLLEDLGAGERPGDVGRMLEWLDRRGLVRESPRVTFSGEQELMFRSEALRDIAYRSVPRHARQELHLRVATWLEQRGPQGSGAAEIAGHFEAASAPARARPHFLRAAEQSVAVHAHAEAVTFYRRALLAWPESEAPRERTQVLRSLAHAQAHAGQYESALGTLDAAARLLDPPQPEQTATLELDRARLLKEMGNIPEALAALERGLAAGDGREADPTRVLLLADRAFLRARQGHQAGAFEDCERGRALVVAAPGEDAGWKNAGMVIANTLGGIHLYAGRLDEAERWLTEAMRLGETVDNVRAQWIAQVNLGAIAFHRASYAAAAAHFKDALALARKANRRRDIAVCLNNLGQAQLAAGAAPAGIEVLEQARDLAEQMGVLDVLADSARALAEAWLAAGAADSALEQALKAIDVARGAGLAAVEVQAHGLAMEALRAAAGSLTPDAARRAARSHFERAVSLLRASEGASREAEIATLEARWASLQDHFR